jgi:hypothetical protein
MPPPRACGGTSVCVKVMTPPASVVIRNRRRAVSIKLETGEGGVVADRSGHDHNVGMSNAQ